MTDREPTDAQLSSRADHLYGLPLDEFTPARNKLADDLKKKGDKDAAKRVRALKKPSLAAWAVNQVARERPEEIGALLEATERIKDAATADEMRTAVAERHRRVKALVGAAKDLLEVGGHAAGASTLDQITRTLYATVDEDERVQIEQGRLAKSLESSGFDAAPGLSLDAMVVETDKGTLEEDPERRKLENELQEAEERQAELDREAAKARLAADTADSEAAQARRTVIKLRDRLERLRG